MSQTFFISAVEKRGIKNGSSGLTALAQQHTLRQKRFLPKDFPSPTRDCSCVSAYTHRENYMLPSYSHRYTLGTDAGGKMRRKR